MTFYFALMGYGLTFRIYEYDMVRHYNLWLGVDIVWRYRLRSIIYWVRKPVSA